MVKCKTNYNNSFIAGFLEGDGTAFTRIRKDSHGYFYFRPIISFANNEKWLLKNIEKELGLGWYYEQKYRNPNTKHTYYLRYDSLKKVRPIVEKLVNEYLSLYRQKQFNPIVEKLGIKTNYSKDINLEWLKGFVTAEGSLFLSKKHIKEKEYSYLNFSLAQKDKSILIKIKEFLNTFYIESILVNDGTISNGYRLDIHSQLNINRLIEKLEIYDYK